MKALVFGILAVVALGLGCAGVRTAYLDGASAGANAEATYVQSTCEDNNAATHINGRDYVCVTPEIWNQIAKRLKERGA